MRSRSQLTPSIELAAERWQQGRSVDPLVAAILRRGDSVHTRRAYAGDLRAFSAWLAAEGLYWVEVTGDDLDKYREMLATSAARSTVNRRFYVFRALYLEATRRSLIDRNPAEHLRGLRGRDERDGGALSRVEARDVLAS